MSQAGEGRPIVLVRGLNHTRGEGHAAIRALFTRLGIAHAVVPMTDAPVRTVVHTADVALAFKDYLVCLRCAPAVTGVSFAGAEAAKPSPSFAGAMAGPTLRTVIICPSNPLPSIDPILSIPGVRDWLCRRCILVVAVSPLVGGKAIRGPAGKIFRELGRDASAQAVADHYRGLIDGLIIDTMDAPARPELEAFGLRAALGGQSRVVISPDGTAAGTNALTRTCRSRSASAPIAIARTRPKRAAAVSLRCCMRTLASRRMSIFRRI